MFSSAEMGNETTMMPYEHLLREEHCPDNQIVCKTPLFEPVQHMLGEQD